MMHKLARFGIIGAILLSIAWTGYRVFCYFTHTGKPMIMLRGIQDQGSYQGSINATLCADDVYKIHTITLTLDGKPYEPTTENGSSALPYKINRKHFSYSFVMNTKDLEHGKHTLTAVVTDASYNRNTNSFSWDFYADNVELQASFVQSGYKIDQGKTVHIKIATSKPIAQGTVTVFGKNFNVHHELDGKLAECFIPIDCEQTPGEYMIEAVIQDAVKNTVKLTSSLTVQEFAFKKQKGFHVSNQKLEEEKEVSMNTKILDEALCKWLEQSPTKKMWSGAFVMPMDVKRITTPHGEIRMTPARGRYMHKGLDLVNVPKNVVWASQTGRVIIKDRFLIPGNIVVLDHGMGVFSKYCHLEDFADIEVGDIIKKGCPIGRVGMTGYASGYHLHWEIMVQNVSVDPYEWTTTVY